MDRHQEAQRATYQNSLQKKVEEKCQKAIGIIPKNWTKDYLKWLLTVAGALYELKGQFQNKVGFFNKGLPTDAVLLVASAVVTGFFAEDIKRVTDYEQYFNRLKNDLSPSEKEEEEAQQVQEHAASQIVGRLGQAAAILSKTYPENNVDIFEYINNAVLLQKAMDDLTNCLEELTQDQQYEAQEDIQNFQKILQRTLSYCQLARIISEVPDKLLSENEKIKLLLRCSLLTRQNELIVPDDLLPFIHFTEENTTTDIAAQELVSIQTHFKTTTITVLLNWINDIQKISPKEMPSIPKNQQTIPTATQLSQSNLCNAIKSLELASKRPTKLWI